MISSLVVDHNDYDEKRQIAACHDLNVAQTFEHTFNDYLAANYQADPKIRNETENFFDYFKHQVPIHIFKCLQSAAGQNDPLSLYYLAKYFLKRIDTTQSIKNQLTSHYGYFFSLTPIAKSLFDSWEETLIIRDAMIKNPRFIFSPEEDLEYLSIDFKIIGYQRHQNVFTYASNPLCLLIYELNSEG